MGRYPIAVAGESFENSDGSSRQKEIARCRAGEPVHLEREPENAYDALCVKVVSARGVQIGNISRDYPWIAERIDKGLPVAARILSVSRAAGGRSGVVIEVSTDADDGIAWAEASPPGCAQQMHETGCGIMQGCAALLLLAISVWLAWAILTG